MEIFSIKLLQRVKNHLGELFIATESEIFGTLAISGVGYALLYLVAAIANMEEINQLMCDHVIGNSTLSRSCLLKTAKQHLSTKDRMKSITYRGIETIYINEVIEEYKSEEEMMYFNLLKECDKVALILPEYLCLNLTKQLKKDAMIRSHVFTGRHEFYTNGEWMFEMNGVIQPYLLERIKSAYETGFWMRWRLLEEGMDIFFATKLT